MKTTTLLAVMAMLLMLSCQKAQTVTEIEKDLNLEAPSGQQIAASIQELKIKATQVLFNRHNDQNIELTGIDFLPLSKGYAATITYRLNDGTTGSYAIVSGHKMETYSKDKSNHGKGSIVYDESAKQITLICTGYCLCRAYLHYNHNNQSITYSCGCETCYGSITVTN